MGDPAIRVEGLGKRYTLGERPGLVRRWLVDAWRLRRDPAATRAARNSIWAIRDVSFEIGRGEVVGIIGRNGAGKSTLLKVLSRIVRPDAGCAEIHGRVGALLEVGTGFHPELTGRDNILLNGAILGMKKTEIARKFDEIVAFAGVEKFIDTAVKHYSSGMYVRLAFAVAAHLQPEILLVDEVLAVGDLAFQHRCLDRMDKGTRDGRTVLFVSHNLAAVGRLCRRTLWLDGGKVRLDGPTEDVIASYIASEATLTGERAWEGGIANPDTDELRLHAVRVRDSHGTISAALDARLDFSIELEYEIRQPLPLCRIGVVIETVDGIVVMEAYDADDERHAGARVPGIFTSRCVIPGYLLNTGRFVVSVNAGIIRVKNLVKVDRALSFDIVDAGAVGAHLAGRVRRGVIRSRLEWSVERKTHETMARV